jgi:hypothetical protein
MARIRDVVALRDARLNNQCDVELEGFGEAPAAPTRSPSASSGHALSAIPLNTSQQLPTTPKQSTRRAAVTKGPQTPPSQGSSKGGKGGKGGKGSFRRNAVILLPKAKSPPSPAEAFKFPIPAAASEPSSAGRDLLDSGLTELSPPRAFIPPPRAQSRACARRDAVCGGNISPMGLAGPSDRAGGPSSWSLDNIPARCPPCVQIRG